MYKKKIDKEGMEEKITTFMGNTTTPTISEAQKDKCEGLVVESELLYALKQMKNGSAPGCDGITVEFLKMFWAHISKLLTLSFNSAFENGNLSSSQRKAVITLIHKGKDLARDNLKNWRPISLTNSDYKLLAKCLALRLGDVINDVVSGDQVGYIKGRRVSMLLRLIDDVTDQLNVRQKPGLLLTIDYCQAFDRISKDFMIYTFKKFGFGPDFVKWVSVLMADTKRCVAYCGWLSEYFAVEAGIRQGCPLSPLAFVLAVELLAIKIRQCENIKGLNYWKARNGPLESIIKIALYADDLTLFLKDEHDMQKDEHDMQQALEILAEFSTFSGLEINRMKSEAMWLGSKQNCTDTFF